MVGNVNTASGAVAGAAAGPQTQQSPVALALKEDDFVGNKQTSTSPALKSNEQNLDSDQFKGSLVGAKPKIKATRTYPYAKLDEKNPFEGIPTEQLLNTYKDKKDIKILQITQMCEADAAFEETVIKATMVDVEKGGISPNGTNLLQALGIKVSPKQIGFLTNHNGEKIYLNNVNENILFDGRQLEALFAFMLTPPSNRKIDDLVYIGLLSHYPELKFTADYRKFQEILSNEDKAHIVSDTFIKNSLCEGSNNNEFIEPLLKKVKSEGSETVDHVENIQSENTLSDLESKVIEIKEKIKKGTLSPDEITYAVRVLEASGTRIPLNEMMFFPDREDPNNIMKNITLGPDSVRKNILLTGLQIEKFYKYMSLPPSERDPFMLLEMGVLKNELNCTRKFCQLINTLNPVAREIMLSDKFLRHWLLFGAPVNFRNLTQQLKDTDCSFSDAKKSCPCGIRNTGFRDCNIFQGTDFSGIKFWGCSGVPEHVKNGTQSTKNVDNSPKNEPPKYPLICLDENFSKHTFFDLSDQYTHTLLLELSDEQVDAILTQEMKDWIAERARKKIFTEDIVDIRTQFWSNTKLMIEKRPELLNLIFKDELMFEFINKVMALTPEKQELLSALGIKTFNYTDKPFVDPREWLSDKAKLQLTKFKDAKNDKKAEEARKTFEKFKKLFKDFPGFKQIFSDAEAAVEAELAAEGNELNT